MTPWASCPPANEACDILACAALLHSVQSTNRFHAKKSRGLFNSTVHEVRASCEKNNHSLLVAYNITPYRPRTVLQWRKIVWMSHARSGKSHCASSWAASSEGAALRSASGVTVICTQAHEHSGQSVDPSRKAGCSNLEARAARARHSQVLQRRGQCDGEVEPYISCGQRSHVQLKIFLLAFPGSHLQPRTKKSWSAVRCIQQLDPETQYRLCWELHAREPSAPHSPHVCSESDASALSPSPPPHCPHPPAAAQRSGAAQRGANRQKHLCYPRKHRHCHRLAVTRAPAAHRGSAHQQRQPTLAATAEPSCARETGERPPAMPGSATPPIAPRPMPGRATPPLPPRPMPGSATGAGGAMDAALPWGRATSAARPAATWCPVRRSTRTQLNSMLLRLWDVSRKPWGGPAHRQQNDAGPFRGVGSREQGGKMA